MVFYLSNCIILLTLGIYLKGMGVESIETGTALPEKIEHIINESRRIIHGREVTDGRPYMVYFKIARNQKSLSKYRNWLCGGVIIHQEYILTSAACIQDVEHFYVVSGTYKYSDEGNKTNTPCIKNGAQKAIWKCVPKNYGFDGHENDNIRWMNNDIAVVKVEEGFDFKKKVKGCDFVPKPIPYNNESRALENPGLVAQIAGWGTTSRYSDWVSRRGINQQNLLEANVEIMSKSRCKRSWGPRYNNIIDNYMICSKNIGIDMSVLCNEKYVDCKDIDYSSSEELSRRGVAQPRTVKIPTNLTMHSANHMENGREVNRKRYDVMSKHSGFCENDHGGPMVYGSGSTAMVIGVISACLVKEGSNQCYGPFLYTSVFKNRQFISCAIYKEVNKACRRQFRSGVTHEEKFFSWKNHPDGPAKNEIESQIKTETQKNVLAGSDNKVFSNIQLRPLNSTTVP